MDASLSRYIHIKIKESSYYLFKFSSFYPESPYERSRRRLISIPADYKLSPAIVVSGFSCSGCLPFVNTIALLWLSSTSLECLYSRDIFSVSDLMSCWFCLPNLTQFAAKWQWELFNCRYKHSVFFINSHKFVIFYCRKLFFFPKTKMKQRISFLMHTRIF